MSESDTDETQFKVADFEQHNDANTCLTHEHIEPSVDNSKRVLNSSESGLRTANRPRVLRKMYECKLCQAQFSTVENYKRHLSKKVSCFPQSDLQIFKKLIDDFIEALRVDDETSMIKLGRQMARLYKVLSDEEKGDIDEDYHDGVLAVLEDLTA